MKIRFKKKRLNYSFILGILWLVLSLIGIFSKENSYWTDYVFLIISLLYLGIYFYERKNQYLSIENGTIKLNKPFEKKMHLTEIKRINKFTGDYILKTNNKEMTINTQLIDPNSLADLNTELEKVVLN